MSAGYIATRVLWLPIFSVLLSQLLSWLFPMRLYVWSAQHMQKPSSFGLLCKNVLCGLLISISILAMIIASIAGLLITPLIALLSLIVGKKIARFILSNLSFMPNDNLLCALNVAHLFSSMDKMAEAVDDAKECADIIWLSAIQSSLSYRHEHKEAKAERLTKEIFRGVKSLKRLRKIVDWSQQQNRTHPIKAAIMSLSPITSSTLTAQTKLFIDMVRWSLNNQCIDLLDTAMKPLKNIIKHVPTFKQAIHLFITILAWAATNNKPAILNAALTDMTDRINWQSPEYSKHLHPIAASQPLCAKLFEIIAIEKTSIEACLKYKNLNGIETILIKKHQTCLDFKSNQNLFESLIDLIFNALTDTKHLMFKKLQPLREQFLSFYTPITIDTNSKQAIDFIHEQISEEDGQANMFPLLCAFPKLENKGH